MQCSVNARAGIREGRLGLLCRTGSVVLPPPHADPGGAAWVRARPIVRGLRLRDCAWLVDCEGIVFEECVFDGLRVHQKNPLRLSGCGFRHVVLRGQLGSLWLSDELRYTRRDYAPIDARASSAFYEAVDWALDIAEAKTSALEIECVPADKVRRSAELHGLLRREKADVDRLRAIEGVEYTAFPSQALRLTRSDRSSTILIAHTRSKDFKLQRAALENLRRAGIVE